MISGEIGGAGQCLQELLTMMWAMISGRSLESAVQLGASVICLAKLGEVNLELVSIST